MAASDAIGTVADFDSGYSQPLDRASVPESDARNQRNGFIDSQFFEKLGKVRFCKVRWRHLHGLGSGPGAHRGQRQANYIPACLPKFDQKS